jgi:hypothetical protein
MLKQSLSAGTNGEREVFSKMIKEKIHFPIGIFLTSQ